MLGFHDKPGLNLLGLLLQEAGLLEGGRRGGVVRSPLQEHSSWKWLILIP